MGRLIGLLALLALVPIFFWVNDYIYQEKQAEPLSLADGTHLGFIRALTDNGTRMDFDDGVWLTGEAALEAAIAAGECEGVEQTYDNCAPAGWYIQNTDSTPESVGITSGAEFIMWTYEMETRGEPASIPITRELFGSLLGDAGAHWDELPYTITIENGTVIRIEEVYIP